jgi:RNA-directed DNA polymerase
MEGALGIKYDQSNRNRAKYALCRYADDFVIMCPTKEDAENLYPLLSDYLTERGLTLAEDKTRIIHAEDGFNFLGFNVRRYNATKCKKGQAPKQVKKLLIKPSKESVKALRTKISEIFGKARGANAEALIGRINPIIIGTANYWKPCVAKESFVQIDHYTWGKVKRWINRSHPSKNWAWKRERYIKPDKMGQSKNNWIFTDPVTGMQIRKMAWTEIKRHTLVAHDNSPFDSNLTDYYHKRDIKQFENDTVLSRQKLAKKQNYVCPICGRSIVDFKEGLEIHHIIPKYHGGSDEYKNLQLVHISCHIEYHKAFPAKAEMPPQAKVTAWQKWYRKSIG